MKVNVQNNVSAHNLSEALPPRFRPLLNAPPTQGKTFTLLVFSGDKVLVSTAVEKAIQNLDAEPNQLLVFGYNFTEEASNLLKARGAFIYSLRDSHWTDAIYKKIAWRW